MKVLFCFCDKDIQKFLSESGNMEYIYLGEKDPAIPGLLSSYGFQELVLESINEESYRQEAVRQYVDLIGKTAKEQDSLLWMATFTASKNKFVSKLFQDLLLYHALIEILKQTRDRDILIINLPDTITSALVHFCQQKKIDVHGLPGSVNIIVSSVLTIINTTCIRCRFLVREWFKIFISRHYFKMRIKEAAINEHDNYVIRSTFYERTITDGEYHDSFFGNLPDYLRKDGRVLILAGPVGNYLSVVRKISSEKKHLIVTEELFLSYIDPLRTLFHIIRFPIKIMNHPQFFGLDVTEILQEHVDRECRLYTCDQLIFHPLINNLLSTIDMKTFLTTYENNPWERICFSTIQSASPSTFIIGYQHAALSKASLNMVLSSHEKGIIPVPDRIVTVGAITRDFLINTCGYDSAIVREGCGLRFTHLFKKETCSKRTRRNTILVAPEGILSESVRLTNFIHNALRNRDDIQVILRPHPALPFSDFCKFLDFNPDVSKNFMVSTIESVAEDLSRSDIIIYHGSTLALEALKIGIPVVYLDLSDIISVNPLFDSHGLNWVARSERELGDVITTIYGITAEGECRMGPQDYLYIIPVSQCIMNKIRKSD